MLCTKCKCEIEETKSITISDAIDKASKFFNTTAEILISGKRNSEIVERRAMLMKYLRTQKYTLKKIGWHLGKKHHTSVMHSLKTINSDIKNYQRVELQYGDFLNFINK